MLEAYREGDGEAARILDAAMAAFAPQLISAAQFVGDSDPIVLIGGLMRQSDILVPILKKHLPDDLARRIRVSREDAAVGALLLAGAPITKGETAC